MFVMGTGVCGVCGRDGFGVLGPRGVNGLADGLSTCFLTTGVVPVAPPAVAAVPVGTVAELLVGVGAAGNGFLRSSAGNHPCCRRTGYASRCGGVAAWCRRNFRFGRGKLLRLLLLHHRHGLWRRLLQQNRRSNNYG